MRGAVTRSLLALLAACSLTAPASAQPARDRVYTGPALVCGTAFALRLAAGERLTYRDPGIDFLLYYAEGPEGGFVLYEGNAPMPHDDEIRTGQSFPSVIAIHDNRSAYAKARGRVRDRLLTGDAFRAACQGAPAR